MSDIGAVGDSTLKLTEFGLRSALGTNEAELRAAAANLDEKGQAELGAKLIEQTFLNLLISEMRKTVPENELFGGNLGSKMYTEMLDREYAQLGSEYLDLGLREALLRQILPSQGPESAEGGPKPVGDEEAKKDR